MPLEAEAHAVHFGMAMPPLAETAFRRSGICSNGEALWSCQCSRRESNNTLHIIGMGEVVLGVPNGKIFAKRKNTPHIYRQSRGLWWGVGSETSRIVTLQFFLFQADIKSGFQGHPWSIIAFVRTNALLANPEDRGNVRTKHQLESIPTSSYNFICHLITSRKTNQLTQLNIMLIVL